MGESILRKRRRSLFLAYPKDSGLRIAYPTEISNAEEIEGKLNIILKLDVKNQSANELAETIAHELALHGSDLDKIIKTYEKDGIEAVKKLFASDPDGDMDHKSLAKQDKKHTGVSNYNQVKREMIKKYPSTKKVFDSEQKKYEKEFGN